MVRLLLLLLLTSDFCTCIIAQTSISGKIYDGKNDSLLAGVTVMNLSARQFTLSDKNGEYNLKAGENDLLVFSYSGYAPDTISVEAYMFLTRFDITLKPTPVVLKGVTVVAANYRTDSLNRQAYYQHLLSRPEPGITGGNTPTGFGISLSPFSHFSRESRQRRELKKRLAREEKESYIDHQFSADLVRRITRLDKDSLRLFMYSFRPSYSFCRKTNPQQMLLYINDCLIAFRAKPARKPDE